LFSLEYNQHRILRFQGGTELILFHITRRVDWDKAQQAGQYTAPSLHQEGFIHASTGDQVAGTANLFFKGQSGLVLLVIETELLESEVRFDAVQTHGPVQYFPHIYGPLNLAAVVNVLDFPPNPDGTFEYVEK
jgi:uncharacterized protein (DUF952 family)